MIRVSDKLLGAVELGLTAAFAGAFFVAEKTGLVRVLLGPDELKGETWPSTTP